jgi:hypothetical protein
MRYLFNTIIFTLFLFTGYTQTNEEIDHNYFAIPVKIPIFLSGNFAELRPNHFHAGIDIKTQGKTGVPIYAAADGYVARITISPSGYGKVMYVNHPNGTTTVYGHLDRFASKIEEYVRMNQYEKQSFSIDLNIPEETLPVKKSEQIAFGGNSGSSAGPHLHYEIRRTKDKILLNPLLFDIPVKDKTKPSIQALMIYPISDDATVSGKQSPQRFETILSGNSYQLKTNQTIQVFGRIGFGIQAIDLLDGSSNKCGIFSLKLSVDDELIYSFTMDEFPHEGSKYINSTIDYERSIRTGQRVYRNWIQPGNKLNIFDIVEKHGIYKATDEGIHQVHYEIADVHGNKTSFSFKIQIKEIKTIEKEPKGEKFKYNRNNHIKEDDIEFDVPEGALYDDVDFLYIRKPKTGKLYSPVFQLHDAYTPLHFACNLRIKADQLPVELQSKAMLAQVDPATGKVFSATGKFIDGWVEGNIKVLGNYAIAIDNTAPKITSLSITPEKSLKGANSLKFKITDNLSGVESINGMIDGKWVLFEYDLKNNLISYAFDKERFKFNKNHSIVLEVTDYKGNKSTYKSNFHK